MSAVDVRGSRMGQLTDRRTWLNMQVWAAQLYAAGLPATGWWQVRPHADCVLATLPLLPRQD